MNTQRNLTKQQTTLQNNEITEKPLIVKDLIAELKKHDQNAVVAIENNGYPGTTTTMWNSGFLNGIFYMRKNTRIDTDYYLKEEILPTIQHEFQKVLVINTLIKKDDVNEKAIKSNGLSKYYFSSSSPFPTESENIKLLIEYTQKHLDENESEKIDSVIYRATDYKTALPILRKYINWIDIDNKY